VYCQSRHLKRTFALLILFGVISLACNALIPRSRDGETSERTEPIGFNFTHYIPESPEGDKGAPNHVFIHRYPMPDDGLITGVIYQNDIDDVPETIVLLILRPDGDDWEVIHRVTLLDDDIPPAATGLAMLELKPSLAVKKGDVFAHWQPETRPTGPIPLNLDSTSVDGLSAGKFGFSLVDVEVGQIIPDSGFTGRRDYFMNVIFKPMP